MNIRTGFGYDVHALAENESLWLGGIRIEHYKGTIAHSDGDVLIHAICDALLGAANLRDIGFHFPDTSDSNKDLDSKIILEKTIELIRLHGFELGNIDSTIALQKPRISEYIPKMQLKLSEILGIDTDKVAIKATTTEKLGFEGREEGISAYANVLIFKI